MSNTKPLRDMLLTHMAGITFKPKHPITRVHMWNRNIQQIPRVLTYKNKCLGAPFGVGYNTIRMYMGRHTYDNLTNGKSDEWYTGFNI